MSTTAYYNFITGIDKRQDGAVDHRGSSICDARRQSAISPSSFITTSSSTSSSSLNQINSLTNNVSISTTTNNNTINNKIETANNKTSVAATSCASPNSSTLSSSSASSSSSSNGSTYRRRHSSLLRQSSITPTQTHHTSQMFHSYTLHSLEPKPFKPFKTSSDYLEAMKEDLAEWLNGLYSDLDLTPDNFFASLDNGAIICRHANHVTQMGRNLMHIAQNESSISSSDSGLNDTSNFNISNTSNESNTSSNKHTVYNNNNNNSPSSPTASDSSLLVCNNNNKQEQHLSLQTRSFSPRSSLSSTTNNNGNINWFNIKMLPFKQDAKPGTFFARDNICQFILWCRSLNILECLLFETDDLVARKNEKSFILCLLEVARIGFKVGMPTPLIIQLEQEIDREIENEAKIQKQLEEDEKRNQDNNTFDNFVEDEDETDDGVCEESEKESLNDKKQLEQKNELSFKEQAKNEENKNEVIEDEQNKEDMGPKPQVITNDLVSLHEKVVQLLCQCTCPTQFPMVRVGDNGKYKVGDKLIIFVRILRRHIMVRVGGGWQELSEFLRVKDPCRSKQSFNHNSINNNTFNHQHHIKDQLQYNCNSYNNHNYPQIQFKAKIAPNSYIPTTTNTTILRSRFVESTNHLNKGHQFRNGQRLISGSASMSWLSHNS